MYSYEKRNQHDVMQIHLSVFSLVVTQLWRPLSVEVPLITWIKHFLESNVSEVLPPLCGVLADLLRAASTGPAFEPHLLVLGGPTAALNLGEASCLSYETPHPAARTKRQMRTINLCKPSEEHLLQIKQPSLHSYWLLLAEKKTAKLGIGSWVGEAKNGTLGWGLSTLRNLIGRSPADWWLLTSRSSCSHAHLKEGQTS